MVRIKNISVENARIIFRNFKGKGDKFNPEGRRTFGLIIDPDSAASLEEEGWHIKYIKPREEGEEPQPWLPVRVNYKTNPPAVYLVTKLRGKIKKTLLSEDQVGILDNAEFENIDLTVSPYNWSMPNGDEGITAYLKSGYFTIMTDPFYEKYEETNISESDEIPFE